ncbi:MAG: BCCT family transporter [Rhodobacter sp.]|nr:BCCT family transporter [Rhodobacter sp.]
MRALQPPREYSAHPENAARSVRGQSAEERKGVEIPFTHLPIPTATSGFYEGFRTAVTITAKVLIGLLIIWAAAFPEPAGTVLSAINGVLLKGFGAWYVHVMAFYLLACLIIAAWPATGRLRLSANGERPEFSSFSWFSMMFGIGMLTCSTAEPIYHFATNPDGIQGSVAGAAAETTRSAYEWAFPRWGLSAWGCYALTSLALAFFSCRRGLPLTIRSGLTPLFGSALSGVGKGIKWLSNLNMGLTIFLLACFLIINVINAAGDESTKGRIHIIVWGLALTAVIAVLLMAGGLAAIQTAMIIGALPFSIVLALTGVALIKALVRDGMRIRAGMPPAGKEPAE